MKQTFLRFSLLSLPPSLPWRSIYSFSFLSFYPCFSDLTSTSWFSIAICLHIIIIWPFLWFGYWIKVTEYFTKRLLSIARKKNWCKGFRWAIPFLFQRFYCLAFKENSCVVSYSTKQIQEVSARCMWAQNWFYKVLNCARKTLKNRGKVAAKSWLWIKIFVDFYKTIHLLNQNCFQPFQILAELVLFKSNRTKSKFNLKFYPLLYLATNILARGLVHFTFEPLNVWY